MKTCHITLPECVCVIVLKENDAPLRSIRILMTPSRRPTKKKWSTLDWREQSPKLCLIDLMGVSADKSILHIHIGRRLPFSNTNHLNTIFWLVVYWINICMCKNVFMYIFYIWTKQERFHFFLFTFCCLTMWFRCVCGCCAMSKIEGFVDAMQTLNTHIHNQCTVQRFAIYPHNTEYPIEFRSENNNKHIEDWLKS